MTQSVRDSLTDAEQVYRQDAGFGPHIILAAACGNSAAYWMQKGDYAGVSLARRAAHHAFRIVPELRG